MDYRMTVQLVKAWMTLYFFTSILHIAISIPHEDYLCYDMVIKVYTDKSPPGDSILHYQVNVSQEECQARLCNFVYSSKLHGAVYIPNRKECLLYSYINVNNLLDGTTHSIFWLKLQFSTEDSQESSEESTSSEPDNETTPLMHSSSLTTTSITTTNRSGSDDTTATTAATTTTTTTTAPTTTTTPKSTAAPTTTESTTSSAQSANPDRKNTDKTTGNNTVVYAVVGAIAGLAIIVVIAAVIVVIIRKRKQQQPQSMSKDVEIRCADLSASKRNSEMNHYSVIDDETIITASHTSDQRYKPPQETIGGNSIPINTLYAGYDNAVPQSKDTIDEMQGYQTIAYVDKDTADEQGVKRANHGTNVGDGEPRQCKDEEGKTKTVYSVAGSISTDSKTTDVAITHNDNTDKNNADTSDNPTQRQTIETAETVHDGTVTETMNPKVAGRTIYATVVHPDTTDEQDESEDLYSIQTPDDSTLVQEPDRFDLNKPSNIEIDVDALRARDHDVSTDPRAVLPRDEDQRAKVYDYAYAHFPSEGREREPWKQKRGEDSNDTLASKEAKDIGGVTKDERKRDGEGHYYHSIKARAT